MDMVAVNNVTVVRDFITRIVVLNYVEINQVAMVYYYTYFLMQGEKDYLGLDCDGGKVINVKQQADAHVLYEVIQRNFPVIATDI